MKCIYLDGKINMDMEKWGKVVYIVKNIRWKEDCVLEV